MVSRTDLIKPGGGKYNTLGSPHLTNQHSILFNSNRTMILFVGPVYSIWCKGQMRFRLTNRDESRFNNVEDLLWGCEIIPISRWKRPKTFIQVCSMNARGLYWLRCVERKTHDCVGLLVIPLAFAVCFVCLVFLTPFGSWYVLFIGRCDFHSSCRCCCVFFKRLFYMAFVERINDLCPGLLCSLLHLSY